MVRERLPSGPAREGRYPVRYRTPYAVDWRFLPEGALLAKDLIRDRLTGTLNALALDPVTSPIWSRTIGRGTLAAVARAGVLFIHIPKTGGTSISRHIYGRNLPHYTAQFYREAFGPSIEAWPSFAVLRDPVERLLSGYRFVLLGGTDAVAADRYHRIRLRGLGSIDDFVAFLADHAGELHRLPATFHEQVDFIGDSQGRLLVDRLFAMDRDHGFPAELGDWLGLPGPFDRLNATPPIPIEVSAATRAKILEIYRRDVALFREVGEADQSRAAAAA